MNLSAPTSDRGIILLIDSYYSVEESGWGQWKMPILHLCGRNSDNERRVVNVHSFRPRFYIAEQEFVQRRGSIERQLEKRSSPLLDYGTNHSLMDGRDVVDGVMLVCETPNDVKPLRDNFDRTWEADIQFPQVFKLEKGVNGVITVPNGVSEVHHNEVRPGDIENTDIKERVCTFDIEVKSSESFPNYESPTQEVTSIAAHDSYSDTMWTGVLKHEGWGSDVEDDLRQVENADHVTIYGSDKELLYDFVNWLNEIQPDLVTGWSSNSFDIPYVLNRCLKLNVSGIHDLSPSGEVSWVRDAPRNTNYSLKGVLAWDMLEAYKAVRIGQAKSYKLEDIAQDELGYGKDDVNDFDTAWKNSPKEFLKYNIKDVLLVVELMNETDALTDFRGRRELTGQRLDKAQFPRNLIDPSFLSHGRQYLK